MPSDHADFRWKFGRHWFGLTGESIEEQVRVAIHYPYGEPKQQGFWSSNRAMEPLLAAPLSATAADILASPDLVDEAGRLLAMCNQADAVLNAWREAAPRNRVTADFLAHDVHIHATLARRMLAVSELKTTYDLAKELPVADGAATLAPSVEALEALAEDYRRLEMTFDRSVLEAGGGKAGWGGWYPFVTSGGVMFRLHDGLADIEKQIAHLAAAIDAGELPAELLAQ